MREWQDMLELNRQLRLKGLLKNLCSSEEVEVFEGGTAENKVTEGRDPRYGEILKRLQAAIDDPDDDVLADFEDVATHVTHCLRNLVRGLADNGADADEDDGGERSVASGHSGADTGAPTPLGSARVRVSVSARSRTRRSTGRSQRTGSVASRGASSHLSHVAVQESRVEIWLTDSASLRVEGKRPALAIHEHEGDVLYIYVSKKVPTIAESVLHCYLKAAGFAHGQCVLLERLASNGLDSAPPHECLPDRAQFQLQRLSVSSLCGLVQQTPAALVCAEQCPLPMQQRAALFRYAQAVAAYCKQILLRPSAPVPKVFLPVAPVNTLEAGIVELVYRASWHKPSQDNLASLATWLNDAVRAKPQGQPPLAAVCTRDLILRTLRRAAFIELGLLYRRFLPYPVRDPDVITTYTEMMGYNDDQLMRMFGLRKHKFGKLLFREVRQQMREDNPDPSEFFDEATADAKKKSQDAIKKAKNGEVYVPADVAKPCDLQLGCRCVPCVYHRCCCVSSLFCVLRFVCTATHTASSIPSQRCSTLPWRR